MKKTIVKIISVLIAIVCIAGLTAVFAFGAENEPKLNIEGYNLSFSDSVYIEYAVSSENVGDVKLLIWTSPADKYVKGTENAVLSSAYTATVNGKECKVFDYKDLAAKQMTDNVYACAYTEVDGVGYYSSVKKYSVLQYAYNKLGKTGVATTDENLKALLEQMLQYGASAQIYFGYKTDRLATADFYQVSVSGGYLPDKFSSGLYLPGETVTITAPATNAEGEVFAYWQNSAGEIISTDAQFVLTVTKQNETYTAIYEKSEKASVGLEYIGNGDGTCYVSGIGTCTDNDIIIPKLSPDGKRVTGIKEFAFLYCGSLTSITIPDSVTSIGEYAFYGCSSLTSITIPDSVTSIGEYAFYGCSSLTSSAIPANVTSIGEYAFSGCSNLESIVVSEENSVYHSADNCLVETSNKKLIAGCQNSIIPTDGSVTSIGNGAFGDCSSLTSITIPEGVTSIGNDAFWGCSSLTSIRVPDSVTSIGNDAFSGCSNLESIIVSEENSVYHSADNCLVETSNKKLIAGCQNSIIPTDGSVTHIGYGAFYGCSLTSITIPNCVTSIEDCAFKECISLISVNFSNISQLSNIGNHAFYGCSSLTSITIPDSVTKIGFNAFFDCISLAKITIPDSVTSIGFFAFGRTAYYNNEENWENGALYIGKHLINTRTSISDSYEILPGTLTIAGSAFYGCSSLTSITIPDSVTSIGDYAFYNCSSLTSITIPDSVTSIDEGAFYNCTSLTSIVFQGTREQWDSISKGSGWDSGTGNYIVTYTEVPTTEPGYSEGLEYISNDDGTCSVAGIGTCTDTDIIIPPVYNGDSVTSIGDYAFYDCSSLTSITIPDSVTSIGDRALSGCSSLTSVTFGDGSQLTSIGSSAFYNCSSLTSITIPSGVTSIGSEAFYGCSSLTSVYTTDLSEWCIIKFNGDYSSNPLYYANNLYLDGELITDLVIPDRVTIIGDWAFSGCSSLTSITIPDSVTGIGYKTFGGCGNLTSVTFGNNSQLTSIGDYAFDSCSNLTSITIPDSVTSIGSAAFRFCSLTSITIPDSVTSIGNYAFDYCSNLTSVTIPDSVTNIGKYAFSGCSSLTSITIPDGVTSIGDGAFSNCIILESIVVSKENSVYHSTDNCLIETASNTLIFGCGNSVIPTDGSVTSIGDYAFSGCSSLTSITIPDSVTIIGDWAFSGCSSLTSITIPNGVTSIGNYAFRNCSSLTSITIPDSVMSIGDCAFLACGDIESIIVSDKNSAYHSADSCLIETASKTLVLGCKNSVIPTDGSVSSIGDYAFFECRNLMSITIPDSVTNIGHYAFSGCSGLTNVTFGDNSQLTSVGDMSFNGCSNLTSITIPDSETSIGKYAFWGCSSLTSVTFENTTGWWYSTSDSATSGMCISSSSLSDPSTAAEYLTSTYRSYYWKRS